MQAEVRTEIKKVDEELGLVLGFAVICKIDGQDYTDLQGDHIPEEVMVKAAMDFMMNSGKTKEMHDGNEVFGEVAFAFPLTTEIAKSFDIETKTTGLMFAVKPSPSVLQKFKSGVYTGFSIGGQLIESELV